MGRTISTVTINADGRTASILVLATGVAGTYLHDSSNTTLVDVSTAKVVFDVTSEGYNGSTLGTRTRKVYGVCPSRHSGVQPSGPGSFENDEDVSGSDVIITIALSEPIYQDDNTGTGKSGTAPVVRILADWYTLTGTGTDDTGASFAVTNNSTLVYFEGFGQWDNLPFERVTSDFRLAFMARHIHGIEGVIVEAVGATSSHTQTSSIIKTQTGRVCLGSGFTINAYEATIPLSGFTQGEKIDIRAYAYSKIGDTVFDTNNFTVAGGYATIEGRGPRYFVCDKNGGLVTYGVVDSVTGTASGTVSTTLATAEGDPYQTWKQAVDAGATHVYFNDVGPHTIAARSANASADWSITSEPHPNQTGTVVLNRSGNFAALRIAPCKFKGVEINLGGTLTMWDGSTNGTTLIYEDCYLDDNTYTLAEHDYNFDGVYYKDCVCSDLAKLNLQSGGGDEHRLWFDGCVAVAATSHLLRGCWRVVGCNFPNAHVALSHAGSSAELPRNFLWESSLHLKMGVTSHNLTAYIDAAISCISICGVVSEGLSGLSGSPIMTLVEGVQHTVSNIVFAHNTFWGERVNAFYDDGASARTSIGVKAAGLVLKQWNCATDLFHNTGPYTGREGRWWYGFGTQTYSTVTKDTTATFNRPFIGIGSAADGVDPTFVNDLSGSSGGGDYHLTSQSVGRRILYIGTAVLEYDLYGTPIRNDGTGDAGGFQTFDPRRSTMVGSF